MRTEAQQLAALRAAIKHKGPMGRGEWDRFRRNASSGSKGWPVARLDAWAVRMIEAKVLRPTLFDIVHATV